MRAVLALAALAAAVLAGTAAAATPRAEARADLVRCRDALAPINFTVATKAQVPRRKRFVQAAIKACADKARLQSLSNANSADTALSEAASAEVGLADGLANYAKYLGDVAAGQTGHAKIRKYATEEIRQARLLLGEALVELK